MTTIVSGLLLDGDLAGQLNTVTHVKNMAVSTSSALVGTVSINGNGLAFTSSANLNGVQSVAADVWVNAFFNLSNPADVGKVRVTWTLP
jgi:2-methylaconitate cis-trans-isomerase PrpF